MNAGRAARGLVLLGSILGLGCGDSGEAVPNPYAGYTSTTYADTAPWLCHPDVPGTANVCNGDLRALRVEPDGNSTVEPFVPAEDPPVDCFYVYPTVSMDLSDNSDLTPGAQEIDVTLIQAGRYGSVCRVFAPVYRQRTLTLLALDTFADPLVTDEQQRRASEIAYADVLDAFKHYVAHHNHGRGFFLLGHSQGARLLAQLVAEEIETTPFLARRMIAAHIPGTLIEVPSGQDVGGTLKETPACRGASQTGCVVAYSSYREGDPELTDPVFGVTDHADTQALCVNPASPAAGSSDLDAYLPFVLPPVFQALLIPRGAGGPYEDPELNRRSAQSNRFFSVPGQLRGQCIANEAGANYLQVTISADPTDARADDYPGEFFGGRGWGLHIADVSLVQGDLVRLAATQSEAWLR